MSSRDTATDGLFARLAAHVRRRPGATAVREAGPGGAATATLSRAELLGEVEREARRVERERPAGALVTLDGANDAAYVVRFLAVLRAGRSVFPLHPELTRAEREDLARRTGAASASGLPPGSLVLPSSGTTGGPKIVLREARSVDAVAANVAAATGLAEEDRVLAAIPLFHSYGIENALLAPLVAGATIDVLPGFEPRSLLDRIGDGGPTVLPGVPLFFETLLRFAAPVRGRPRLAYSAGAPLPGALEAEFAERFGHRIGQLYGATEIGSVTFDSPDAPDFEPGSVGRPMEGVEIRILPLSGEGPGTDGEVAVRAPSMLSRYLDDAGPTLVDGFFPTGDLGRVDGRGRLTLSGRAKLLVDVGGNKVNPLEVEAVLTRHPAVRECVVVPMPAAGGVTRLRACVLLEEGRRAGAAELRSFARKRLAPFKVPRAFEFPSELPRSPAGKVRRSELAGIDGSRRDR